MERKFLFVCYRDWAKLAYENLSIEIPIVFDSEELSKYIESSRDLKYIFFVGWSDIIPEAIINKFECYCIHPSELPKYRGGSPIQNQIIDGVLDSAVTMFKMVNQIDAGPIYKKHYLSLDSKLDLIFTKLGIISSTLINDFIFDVASNSNVILTSQDDSLATFRKRRKPSDSEIRLDDFSKFSAADLSRKINCLVDPYPNAYVVCADGKKLFIRDSSHE